MLVVGIFAVERDAALRGQPFARIIKIVLICVAEIAFSTEWSIAESNRHGRGLGWSLYSYEHAVGNSLHSRAPTYLTLLMLLGVSSRPLQCRRLFVFRLGQTSLLFEDLSLAL